MLLDTAKGDGAAEALRVAGCRWHWSRSIGQAGAWYVPHSRDRASSLWLIEHAAAALRAAGFTVKAQIDATPRTMDHAEAERAPPTRRPPPSPTSPSTINLPRDLCPNV